MAISTHITRIAHFQMDVCGEDNQSDYSGVEKIDGATRRIPSTLKKISLPLYESQEENGGGGACL